MYNIISNALISSAKYQHYVLNGCFYEDFKTKHADDIANNRY